MRYMLRSHITYGTYDVIKQIFYLFSLYQAFCNFSNLTNESWVVRDVCLADTILHPRSSPFFPVPFYNWSRCFVLNLRFIFNLGSWSNWGAFNACSKTCQSNVIAAPTQSRRRTCNGGRFDGTCTGSSVDTRNCNIGVTCPGTSLSYFSPFFLLLCLSKKHKRFSSC